VEVEHHKDVGKAIERALTLAPNTESVATFITTCYLKKGKKIKF
jgi:hypothetical protein